MGVPVDVTRALRNYSEQQGERLPTAAAAALSRADPGLPDWRVPRDVTDVGTDLVAWLQQQYAPLDDEDIPVFSRALIARLGADLPDRLRDRPVPADVSALVPAALNRLLVFLQDARSDYRLGRDFFLKDLRLVTGLSVPTGALLVDLRSRMSRRQSLALTRSRPSLAALSSLARGRPLGPWLHPHIDTRYLRECNEPGYDESYRRIASLLLASPDVWGMHATTWLYDPQLSKISSRHDYLRSRPLDHGGVLLPSTTTDFDVESALASSSRRRELYEQGLYKPQSYSIVWLRDDMIAWATG